jgi:putative membrane protein
MDSTLASSLAGARPFALYFGTSLALLAVFVAAYATVTPYREIPLIRQGNKAAALSFAGAVIGFVIPVSKAIAQSSNLIDMLVWAGVAFVAQLLAYLAAALLVPHFRATITDDHLASGIVLAALSIGIGCLNAACMTV